VFVSVYLCFTIDNSSSSSGERSRLSRTPQAVVKGRESDEHSEEDDRESFSHLLQENEAEYYKILLNQVLGGSKDGRGVMEAKASSRMEGEETWNPPAHPTMTQASVSQDGGTAASLHQSCRGSGSEGVLRGDEVAASESFSLDLAQQGSYQPMTESSCFSTPDPNSRTFNLPSFLCTSADVSSMNRGGGGGVGGGRGKSTGFPGTGEVSLLSLPPSGINTMLLTAGLWGLDLSMDEDLHQADLIDRKYLQGTSDYYGLRGGAGGAAGGRKQILIQDLKLLLYDHTLLFLIPVVACEAGNYL